MFRNKFQAPDTSIIPDAENGGYKIMEQKITEMNKWFDEKIAACIPPFYRQFPRQDHPEDESGHHRTV